MTAVRANLMHQPYLSPLPGVGLGELAPSQLQLCYRYAAAAAAAPAPSAAAALTAAAAAGAAPAAAAAAAAPVASAAAGDHRWQAGLPEHQHHLCTLAKRHSNMATLM